MSTPQHAIDAANEIGAQLNSWLRDWTSADITNEAFAAIIAAHPDPELARLREERDKLVKFYGEIVAAIGHDRIINEYNQRGRMLSEETNWRKEAESERDQLRTEVAEWKAAHASELSKRIASDYVLERLKAERAEQAEATRQLFAKQVEHHTAQCEQLGGEVAKLKHKLFIEEENRNQLAILDYENTQLRARVAELELQTFDIKKLENELAKVQLVADHRAKALTELEADREIVDWLELHLQEVRRIDPGPTMDCQPVRFSVWTPEFGRTDRFTRLRDAVNAARKETKS